MNTKIIYDAYYYMMIELYGVTIHLIKLQKQNNKLEFMIEK